MIVFEVNCIWSKEIQSKVCQSLTITIYIYHFIGKEIILVLHKGNGILHTQYHSVFL